MAELADFVATLPLFSSKENRLRSVRIGVDVQDVEEIAAAVGLHGESYLSRVCNGQEIFHVRSHPNTCASFLAGRFAAREAVVKLLRLEDAPAPWSIVDLTEGVTLRVELYREALVASKLLGITEILLSIDYGRRYATAVAVADVDFANWE